MKCLSKKKLHLAVLAAVVVVAAPAQAGFIYRVYAKGVVGEVPFAISRGATQLHSLDFGAVPTNMVSEDISLSIKNLLARPLTFAANNVYAQPPFYVVESQCSAVLQPLESCEVKLRFEPNLAMRYSGSIQISSDALNYEPVLLSGLGTNAVSPFEFSLAGAVKTTFDFGSVFVDSTSNDQVIRVVNISGQAAALSSPFFSVEPPFSVVGTTCAATLPSKGACDVTLNFTPDASIAYSSTLQLNTALAGYVPVSLKGTGTPPPSPFEVTAGAAPLTSYDFGSTGTGTNAKNVAFKIQNISSKAVTFGSKKAYTAAPFGRVSSTCGTSLAVSASCTVTLSFTPTAAQAYSGTLEIDSTSPGYVPVPLQGLGLSQPASNFTLKQMAGVTGPMYDLTYANNTYLTVGDGFKAYVSDSLSNNFKIVHESSGSVGAAVAVLNFKDRTLIGESSYFRLRSFATLTPSTPTPTNVYTGASAGQSFATDGSKVIATSPYGQLLYSTDGVTWSATSQNNTYAAAYANNMWVAGGYPNGAGAGKISTSTNGINWTTYSLPTNSGDWPLSFAYGAGRWVAGMTQGLLTSTDGATWTAVTTPFGATNVSGVAYGPGGFVAVGLNGGIMTSIDGLKWARSTSPFGPSENLNAVKYLNGTWVVLGQAGHYATSQ